MWKKHIKEDMECAESSTGQQQGYAHYFGIRCSDFWEYSGAQCVMLLI